MGGDDGLGWVFCIINGGRAGRAKRAGRHQRTYSGPTVGVQGRTGQGSAVGMAGQ